MRAEIEEWSGFPGCIGFLDGSDINLRFDPVWHAETYFHRKKRYGFNVQAICDIDGRFTFVGEAFRPQLGTLWHLPLLVLSKIPQCTGGISLRRQDISVDKAMCDYYSTYQGLVRFW
jgi:hypothetical protein